MLSQQKRDIDQVVLHGKICVGIHSSRQQRNSHSDNFKTAFSFRSSLDPLSIIIYLSVRIVL